MATNQKLSEALKGNQNAAKNKGGGAAFGPQPFMGKGRKSTLPPTGAGAGRGSVNPELVTKNKLIAGLNYDPSNVQGGRGNYNPNRVDPHAAAGKLGASLGGKAESMAAKAKGAFEGGMASRAGGIKAALQGARQGASRAELNLAENGRGAGAMKGEAIARKAASAVTTARTAAVSSISKAKSSATDAAAKIKARMWGK